MKKFSKVLVFILVVALGLSTCFALVGCNKYKNGELVVMTQFGGTDAHGPLFRSISEKFSKDNEVKIVDRSGSTEDKTFLDAFAADMQSTNNVPDVIFWFSGAAMDQFRDKVMTVADIQKEYSDFAKNITVHDNDPASIEIKSGVQGIMYNSSNIAEDTPMYTEADFATVETLLDKMKEYKSNFYQKAAVSADLPHYWYNHLMVHALGLEEFEAFDGTKAYLDKEGKRDKWEEATLKVVNQMRSIGFGDSQKNGLEASAFYAGTRGIMVDGHWVGSNIDKSDAKANIKFAKFPKVGDQAFYIGGVTNGWFITKKAWDDPVKREQAVKYVMAQITDENLNEYAKLGGAPANGKEVTNGTYASEGFASIAKDAKPVIAIDDRIPGKAKDAYLSTWDTSKGLPKLLYQPTDPTLDDVKTIFALMYDNLA